MIQELVELSKHIRGDKISHDAIAPVPVSIICNIKSDGSFVGFIQHEKQTTYAEALTSKKGKARLLVDKAEEVLGYGENAAKKHALFLEKLESYKNIKKIAPVLLFYNKNKRKGVEAALRVFEKSIDEKERQGNIVFIVSGESKRVHEHSAVYNEIIARYDHLMITNHDDRFKACSICGKTTYPVLDMPHGMIKRVPNGKLSGCALVSFNYSAYESYALRGNENASICIQCGKAYVTSLNWLLNNGSSETNKKGKEYFVYTNRKNISDDTAIVFWLRNSIENHELDLLDSPTVDDVKVFLESVHVAKNASVRRLETDIFYATTISGAAARIAVRDWIEIGVDNLKSNLIHWFDDISISSAGKIQYPPMYRLVGACKGIGKTDVRYGRIGAMLWKSAITGSLLPIWILSSVLNRLRAEQSSGKEHPEQWNGVLADRIALLKLILNRKLILEGRTQLMPSLDENNVTPAYICGRIFAHLERIQYHAIGEANAGIRERFFSFASSMPATAFGRLMKLTQHHLSKIKGEKPGLSVNLDKELQSLILKIDGSRFPATLSLEDQGSFAIGYYHQRDKQFSKIEKDEQTNNDSK